MRRKALKQKKKLESSPFWNAESTELESGIQCSESGIHRVESRIHDCHGFPYMGRVLKHTCLIIFSIYILIQPHDLNEVFWMVYNILIPYCFNSVKRSVGG